MFSRRLLPALHRNQPREFFPKSAQGIARSKSTNSDGSNSGGIFGSANNYLSNLRWKAADALTSTLPDEERSQLLEKLEPKIEEEKVDEKTSTVPQHSIDEAVAAARAQEAAIHSEKWEKEKEKLLAEAEDAARARVESDIMIQKRQIAFEAWKRDLEREKNGLANDPASTAQPKQEEHPLLGPVLLDLGHKRIHVASVKALSSIPVWKKQRVYRHGRARTMATDKMKTLHLGLPGVIGIYEGKDGSLSILDGQHRVGMLKLLQEKSNDSGFNFDQVLVEVYPNIDSIEEADHAKEIFLEVNKAEPVKLVDLPGVAKASHRKIINESAEKLQDSFPDMFSPSQRCRSPHVNIDNLRDALFAANVIQKHSLKSPKALETWILQQNEVLAKKFEDEEAKENVPKRALEKAVKFNFYLGLDSSWLYN